MSTNLYVIDTFSFDTKNQPFSPKLKFFDDDKIEFIEFCSLLVFYKYSFYFFLFLFLSFLIQGFVSNPDYFISTFFFGLIIVVMIFNKFQK